MLLYNIMIDQAIYHEHNFNRTLLKSLKWDCLNTKQIRENIVKSLEASKKMRK